MSKLDRHEIALGVLADIRANGPIAAWEIQENLDITKRETENALYDLAGRGKIEYDYPATAPPRYIARSSA